LSLYVDDCNGYDPSHADAHRISPSSIPEHGTLLLLIRRGAIIARHERPDSSPIADDKAARACAGTRSRNAEGFTDQIAILGTTLLGRHAQPIAAASDTVAGMRQTRCGFRMKLVDQRRKQRTISTFLFFFPPPGRRHDPHKSARNEALVEFDPRYSRRSDRANWTLSIDKKFSDNPGATS